MPKGKCYRMGMHAGRVAFLLLVAFSGGAVPVSEAGATSITRAEFTGFSAIPNVGNVVQTAFRKGDQFGLSIAVYSPFMELPAISADLSELGVPDSVEAHTDPNGRVSFGPFLVSENITDGPKTVFVKVLDQNGDTATSTAQITIDTMLPSLRLSRAAFSAASPRGGDFINVSGSVDGTGSTVSPGQISIAILDRQGNKRDEFSSSLYELAFREAVKSDGAFMVPLILFESSLYSSLENASVEVRMAVYDQAGNTATSSLRVPLAAVDSCAGGTCASNVLFLPGIKASRLYGNESCGGTGEEKFWDPVILRAGNVVLHSGDDKGRKLFLGDTGESICSEIYTRPGDILDSVSAGPVTLNYYRSFRLEMDKLKTDGVLADWRAVAYDWRLSLEDLLTQGREENGKIFYGKATTTPYIEQTLRELAATSKTKKVTIITHSNGGLVAKALLQKLGDAEATRLVDKLVLVGVPQTGAPLSIGALLYGYDQEISAGGLQLLSPAIARQLALNAPMSYHLLPSADYFASVASDPVHPIAHFVGEAYAKEVAAYGNSIASAEQLHEFLLAKEGGRSQPPPPHVGEAAIANGRLLAYGKAQHVALDAWVPPESIKVFQIAGWGDATTVAGIDFYTLPGISPLASSPTRAFRPIFTEDGDGVVPVPSALHMPEAPNVKRYWLDLDSFYKGTKIKRKHADIFEVPSVLAFVKSTLQDMESSLPYFSSERPSTLDVSKKLIFLLHSPLTLEVTDPSGNTTGISADGSIREEIEGSAYEEFGEVKYVVVPQGSEYTLTLDGQAEGTFSLDVQESSGGVVTSSATIASVPTTENTNVTMTISDLAGTPVLNVDEDGDGSSEASVSLKSGEVITYVKTEQETVSQHGQVSAAAEGSSTSQAVAASAGPAQPVEQEAGVVETQPPEEPPLPQNPESAAVLEVVPGEDVVVAEQREGDSVPQLASAAGSASAQSFFSWLWNLLYTVLNAIWSFIASLFS